MKLKSELLVLAREYRELTQDELAKKSGINRIKIAKLESGLLESSSDDLDALSSALQMPKEFFCRDEPIFGYGSSAYYYRKKADLSASDRKRVHSVVNIIRLCIKTMLQQVDVESNRKLPKLSVEDYGGSPAKVAQAVRSFWKQSEGPLHNLTALIESAGILVIPCAFGTRAMDATSIWLADLPPMIFINENVPGDRWRFTLAHELGHLVMHDLPHEEMEVEADCFASELLMPELFLRAEFARVGQLRLRDLAEMKLYWKTSMQALLMCASRLDAINENQSRYLWAMMSKNGYRSKDGAEPNPIPRENPTNLRKLLELFANEMHFSIEDLSALFKLGIDDIKKLFDVSPWMVTTPQNRPSLRLVAF